MYPDKPEEFYTKLKKAKEDASLAEGDPEAPGDPEERMYWIRVDTEMTADNEVEEELQLELEKEGLDEDELKTIAGDEGVFGEGDGLGLGMLSDAGNESLQLAIANAEEGGPPKKKKNKLHKKPKPPQ